MVGLLPAPDLEFGLDHLEDEANSLCLMTKVLTFEDSDDEVEVDPTDFTIYIDPVSNSTPVRHRYIINVFISGTCCTRYRLSNGFGL